MTEPIERFNENAEGTEDARAVLARNGRTFHLASLLLPQQMRTDAAELYAFCRRVDDIADEATAGQEDARKQEIAAVVRALQTDPLSDEAAWQGWPVDLEARYPGISKVAVTLTQAAGADIGGRRIADEQELIAYAFGVAGTVGLMMCRILGALPIAAEAASHLGIAMQLSNIARDVYEDSVNDRVYLPASWIDPAQVFAALSSKTERESAGRALEAASLRLLQLAEHYYRSADQGMRYLPWRARLGILAAAACYREIGVRVGRDVPASWRQRTVVPTRVKALLIAGALIRSIVIAVRSSLRLEEKRDEPLHPSLRKAAR
jgi:phytoene synthase